MRHRLVLMIGGTETLEYFSLQLQKAFEDLGYTTFLFDQRYEEESAAALSEFAVGYDTILLTFNFDGIHYETSLFDVEGNFFWNKRKIPCVNIAVDHPFYFPELFEIHPDIFYEVSIDRFHDKYVKKYYPDLMRGPFLPLGGTSLFPDGSFLPISERPIDVVFTGNYTPPEVFNSSIERLGEEYADFYTGILEDLIENPDMPDDEIMTKHILREIPTATDKDTHTAISNMIFIDTYIRCYYRGKIVRTLLDNGIKVHCVGNGWERLQCKSPQNLTYTTDLLSEDCLKYISQSKISLNIMPWFKDGAHDRVFNSMLNGAICVTDHSIYLDEVIKPGKHAIFYNLNHIEMLPMIIKHNLDNIPRLEKMQKEAFEYAMANHTWAARAKSLHSNLFKFL